jgi:prepilin-type N-terminal cleavage/methylation domain-containing protein
MIRRGFTMIELLMVISIIAVLAALLIPTIGLAKNMARNAKAETQLGTIKASLNIYKDANGFYPESFTSANAGGFSSTLRDDMDVFTQIFKKGNDYKEYKRIEDVTQSDWEDIALALVIQLNSIDSGNYRMVKDSGGKIDRNETLKSLRDPFTGGGVSSKVYRYRPNKFYLVSKNALLYVDQEDPPNPDSYQLWSAGTDGKDQYGERYNGKKSDDITNWKSK